MRLNLKTLRRLIKEVALSPSLPKNNQIVNNPIDNDLLDKAISSIQRQFTKMLEKNLVLSSWKGSYNSETREFNDNTYEFIKEVSEKLGEEVAASIIKTIRQAWIKGHTVVKNKHAA